jgi:hydroxyethylthiazole kinase-like uncharacterized protein yjeF
MPRPSVLSRRNPRLNKKDFGHVLVIAGSPSMLGASALCSLAAMRAGAGLVTVAVPQSLNLTLQKKIVPVVMTRPVPQTTQAAFSLKAFAGLHKDFSKFDAIAIGPGLGLQPSTKAFVLKMIEYYPGPMVVDADALNALSENPKILLKAKGTRILTPHSGEMARLTGQSVKEAEDDRLEIAQSFAKKYRCILVLKGHRTIVTNGVKTVINRSGNVGMATAGSGDVLSGIIGAYLAQGINPFEAARWGVYAHGKAGDIGVKTRSKASLIATDLIEALSKVS